MLSLEVPAQNTGQNIVALAAEVGAVLDEEVRSGLALVIEKCFEQVYVFEILFRFGELGKKAVHLTDYR